MKTYNLYLVDPGTGISIPISQQLEARYYKDKVIVRATSRRDALFQARKLYSYEALESIARHGSV